MKTAMQELIELMESHHKRGWTYMTFDFFFAQLEEIKALEKEKEQIKDACIAGWDMLLQDMDCMHEKYYNQTYQNK